MIGGSPAATKINLRPAELHDQANDIRHTTQLPKALKSQEVCFYGVVKNPNDSKAEVVVESTETKTSLFRLPPGESAAGYFRPLDFSSCETP